MILPKITSRFRTFQSGDTVMGIEFHEKRVLAIRAAEVVGFSPADKVAFRVFA